MIELRGVRFAYPGEAWALELPAFDAAAGEAVAVIGPSGCGKSTLLNLLAGIAAPQRGTIRVDGRELTGLNDAARRDFRAQRIGFVFQTFELLDYLDVAENIRLPYRINPSLGAPPPLEAVRALASEVGLQDKLRRRVDALSQGERQRVALCRALIAQPALILADEPTGNLDPASGRQALDLLLRLGRERNATLIAVTHDRSLLDRFPRVVDLGAVAGSAHA
ncbi:MAG: ABC transporter ATP-binding protein [Planctomycetes bacterium]|nr:ABC transporter ATP-binding protein [Planctomycetota bacterium]